MLTKLQNALDLASKLQGILEEISDDANTIWQNNDDTEIDFYDVSYDTQEHAGNVSELCEYLEELIGQKEYLI